MRHKNGHLVPTHPWIDFKFDVSRLDYRTWIALGECASKCEHIANTPLSPQFSKELHLVYLTKGVRATTAIEGNTLNEEEVRKAVDDTLELPPSREYLGHEVRNILYAMSVITTRIEEGDEKKLTPDILREYNRMVLANLELEEGVVGGELRTHNVGVARYRPPDHKYMRELTECLCDKLNTMEDSTQGIERPIGAILKAIFAHLYIAWIHPFGDGNGRTARLLEVDILLRSGIPSPAVHLLSNHYNATRNVYYQRLDAASRERKAYSFVAYAVSGFRDQLREQLQGINHHVRDIAWTNFVHEQFSGKKTEVSRRRRDVVLALSDHPNPVAPRNTPVLTNRLREYYRKKTMRTIERDIHELLRMELLKVGETGLIANKGLIDAFLPLRRDANDEEL